MSLYAQFSMMRFLVGEEEFLPCPHLVMCGCSVGLCKVVVKPKDCKYDDTTRVCSEMEVGKMVKVKFE